MTLQKPDPISTGSLAQKPFSHILVQVLEKRMTGTLEIRQDTTYLSVYFRNGTPAKVDTTNKTLKLGEILVEMGSLKPEQLQRSLEEMKQTGEFQGQVLVRLGHINGATLVSGITEQMIRKMLIGFRMTHATYAFYPDVNLITSGSSELVNCDPLALLMEGVRCCGDQLPLNAVVGTLRDRVFYLPGIENLSRYRFTRDERMLCRKLLEAPQTLDSLRKWDALDREIIKRVLYVLILTREIRIESIEKESELRQALSPIRFDSTIPPPERASFPPEVMEARKQISSQAALISAQNYYEMLGVSMDAAVNDVRTAFFRLAKQFHPDRGARTGFSDLRETLSYIFANLSEAHVTLTDIDLREAYDAVLHKGGPITKSSDPPVETEEDVAVRKALNASILFQKALVVFKQNRISEAAEMVENACVDAPEDGEMIATRAYLRMRLNTMEVKEAVEILRKVSKEHPKSERVQLFFAQTLKSTKSEIEARKQFQAVLEINPHNIDAAREVRLLDMRRRHSGKQKKPGLFGLFNK